MEISKIIYTKGGTTQHFNIGPNLFSTTTIYKTDSGYYVFYANQKLTNSEMISAIIQNNILISEEYFSN